MTEPACFVQTSDLVFLWPDFLHLQNQETDSCLQGPQMLFS